MDAGDLNCQITFERPAFVREPWATAKTAHWSDVITVGASIEPLSGRELWIAQQVQPQVTHRIRCRMLHGINPKMRIKYKGRTFNIKSILNGGERCRQLEILAVEKIEPEGSSA